MTAAELDNKGCKVFGMMIISQYVVLKVCIKKNKNCACKIQKSRVYYTSQRNLYSSIAQSVEQTAVNRWVVGSSPTRGV